MGGGYPPPSFTSLPKDYHPPNRLNVFPLVADKYWEPSVQEDIPMVINCIKCHTAYQVKRELYQGAKGMQVRCRKCGCTFDVMIILSLIHISEPTRQATSRMPSSA